MSTATGIDAFIWQCSRDYARLLPEERDELDAMAKEAAEKLVIYQDTVKKSPSGRLAKHIILTERNRILNDIIATRRAA